MQEVILNELVNVNIEYLRSNIKITKLIFITFDQISDILLNRFSNIDFQIVFFYLVFLNFTCQTCICLNSEVLVKSISIDQLKNIILPPFHNKLN